MPQMVQGGPPPPALCPLCRQPVPEGTAPPPPGSTLARIEQVLIAMEARLTEPLTLAMLAEIAHLSPQRFAVVFRQIVGDSPHRFLVRRRIERAMTLLKTPMPLAEVALAAGFADQAHFTTSFKQMTGETPGQWRRRHGREGTD